MIQIFQEVLLMEIEKKFLVHQMPSDLEKYEKLQILQAYVSTDPVIRLRHCDEYYYLNVKTKGHLKREEMEIPLTKEQFESLWLKIESKVVSKVRYLVPIDHNLTAEIDIYREELSGLTTIEVEFETEKDAIDFIAPDWFGKDVTHDSRYKNNNLALYGKPQD